MKSTYHPICSRKLSSLVIVTALWLLVPVAAFAQQSGVWTNDASSVWSDTTSWLNGIVADGTDATADFSQVDITAPRTVTVDASHNIGALIFGDPAGTHADNWTLTPSGVSVLTLAVSSGSPTITVSNNAASTNIALLNVPLAGTSGLTKTGNGVLVLGSTNNSYSGATTVSGGTLQLTNANASATGPVLYLSFNNVGGSIVTNGGSGGAAMNGVIVGSGISVSPGAGPNGNAALNVSTGAVNSGYVQVPSPVVNFNTNLNWTIGMWMKTSQTGAVYAYQGDGGWASGNTTFHLNAGTNDQAGASAGGVRNSQGWEMGTSNLVDGVWHFVVMTCNGGVKTSYVDGSVDPWTVINGATMNQWNGNGNGGQFWIGGTPDAGDGNFRLNGQLAEVYVYNRALAQSEIQALMTGIGPSPQPSALPYSAVSVAASTKLDLNGVSSTMAGLTGNGFVDTTLTNGITTLTIDDSSNPTFAGTITNSLGTLHLLVSGSGALTLSGANGYTGNTWLNSGTLNINAASALGSGTGGRLLINGGTLDNTSGAPVTLAANKPEIWYSDVVFNGTTNLNLGTGTVSLSGSGSARQVTVNANTLTVGPLNAPVSGMGLTKAGPGTLVLGGSGASALGGVLTLNGGVVQMSQDINPATALSGTGTLETSGTTVNKWFWLNSPSNFVFSGTLQNFPGTTGRGMGFNKSGLGTCTLNGNVTINDTFTVNAGKLLLSGGGIAITNPNSSGSVPSIGPANGSSGVLILSNNATFLANYTPAQVYNSSFNIATANNTPNAAGSVWMYPGCTFNVNRQLTVGGGNNGSGFAGFSQFGGTTTIGGFIALGGTTNGGVLNLSGGTLLMTGSAETIGYGSTSTGSYGVENIFGTATFALTGAGHGVWPGEVNNGTVNLWGNATLAITNDGVQFAHGNAAANGTFNLDGGILLANFITSVNAAGTFNFNGGTLRANSAGQNGTGIFTPGATATTFVDYSGGTIIDDGGYAITFTQPIQGASGYGISSIPIVSGGSNYIDSPIILITGGSGTGAKAVSQIDYVAGVVTNIMITCPGNNYANSDTLTFTIIGRGGSGLTLGTPTFAPNSAGSLTKLGSGSLTLGSGNSFAGPTMILGGTLNINSSTLITPTDVLATNSTLAIDASTGASFNAGNVTLQNNATVSISYGNLSADPTFPALNASGSLSAPGTGLTIAISGLGLRPGTFTLIKYTGTALASIANFSLTLPPGVTATLVNNQANDSIDLNITTAPQNLTWEGTAGVNWDINTTANWKDANNNAQFYLQYTNGAVIVGDATMFDDTLTNDFVNPQPTNINLTTTLYSFPVVVNSTLPYSFGGVGGIAGSGYLVKSNTGSLFIGTSNSYSGGTIVADGTLIITNDSALGASSGLLTMSGGTLQISSNVTNTRPMSVTTNSFLDIPTNTTMQIGGVSTGIGTLTTVDTGTLVLTGTMSNALAVGAGTLRVAAGKIATTGVVSVGDMALSNGVMVVSGGTVQGNNTAGQFNPGINVGSVAGSAGSIQMSSGTLTTLEELALGTGAGGYAGLNVSGGTAGFGSYLVVGFNGDTAAMNQSGGTVAVLTNCLTIAAGNSTSLAVGNFSGGTFTSINATNGNSGGRGGAFVGENGTGYMNVMGNAALTLIGDANLIMGRTGTASAGTVNLDGGTVTTAQVSKGAGSATLGFNGGTLKASTNNANFMNGLNSATIYGGGAIINDGGFSITVGQALAAPSGYGVSSIPVSSSGGGYIDAPVVTIAGGSGSNATAIAQINYTTGIVTNILVTCPGSGYLNGDSIAVNVTGGGGSGVTVGTPTWAANTGGGLTKLGNGTLTLSGADTYSGTTFVGGGQLIVTPALQVTGTVTVTNGTTFGVLVGNGGTATVGNLNLGTSSTGTNYLSFLFTAGTNPVVAPLQVGTLTSTGTNYVRLGGAIAPGTFPLVAYSGTLAGAGVFATNTVLGPQGLVATLSNNAANSTIYVTVTAVPGLVWTGTNTTAGLANLWSAGVTNWLLGSVPAAYSETVVPGDIVLFNDIGLGTVLVSNTVSPGNVVISNNAVGYVFQGTGHIAGPTGLTKQGSGTATVSLGGETYTGNTVINAGTLQIGSATAIPSGNGAGNVAVNTNATLDLNGLSPTINGLSGGGLINNSSGAASVLTMGSGNASINWAGTINNTGAGGSSLIKIGTNSMVITGTNYLTSAAASQINGGSLLITNGGALYMSGSAEFWVQQNAGTASVVVDGGSLVTSNNWLVVARNNANAIGTLTINHGLVQKAGANNLVVGSLGANGVLTVNGGQVLNNGNLWLGEGTAAHATLNLNGGLLQASQVRENNSGGLPTVPGVANFNGGTFQATAGNTNFFINVTVNVLVGGFIFDDGGFAITNETDPWLDGDGLGGGLVKQGAGALYLDTANTYTGTTLVTNGTLAGIGSITGPVVVAPGANLGAGDAGGIVGTLTINNGLTLQGNATLRINKSGSGNSSDLVTGLTNVNYGGTLTVSNLSSVALAAGDTFTLFSATTNSGNFASIVGSPGSGLGYSFNPTNGVLSIVTTIANNPTNISFTVSGSTMTLSWPTDHLGWILQEQTNSLAVGLGTNWVDVAGSDSVTSTNVTISPAMPTVFYRLRHP